jgi:hypothetical protein
LDATLTQPSWYGLERWVALPSDGCRFDGTTRLSDELLRKACCPDETSCVTAPDGDDTVASVVGAAIASVDVVVAPAMLVVVAPAVAVVGVVVGVAATSCGAAASTPPSSRPTDDLAFHPTSATTSTMAAPSARLRAGTAARRREWRIGSSTNRTDTAEMATDTATVATRCITDSGPHCASASTYTGQCQRYRA